MARLPDTTGPLSPEAQKALGEIVEQVLGASATAQELGVPEGQRAPF